MCDNDVTQKQVHVLPLLFLERSSVRWDVPAESERPSAVSSWLIVLLLILRCQDARTQFSISLRRGLDLRTKYDTRVCVLVPETSTRVPLLARCVCERARIKAHFNAFSKRIMMIIPIWFKPFVAFGHMEGKTITTTRYDTTVWYHIIYIDWTKKTSAIREGLHSRRVLCEHGTSMDTQARTDIAEHNRQTESRKGYPSEGVVEEPRSLNNISMLIRTYLDTSDQLQSLVIIADWGHRLRLRWKFYVYHDTRCVGTCMTLRDDSLPFPSAVSEHHFVCYQSIWLWTSTGDRKAGTVLVWKRIHSFWEDSPVLRRQILGSYHATIPSGTICRRSMIHRLLQSIHMSPVFVGEGFLGSKFSLEAAERSKREELQPVRWSHWDHI